MLAAVVRGVLDHPLDDAVWSALTGPQAALAERNGCAVRYRPDVASFAALPAEPDAEAWAQLGALAAPGETVVLHGSWHRPPDGWDVLKRLAGVQLDGSGLSVRPDPEAVVLGADDLPEMLDLAARTKPGPFLPGTPLMGTYLGIRCGGALVAMAGERMRPPGWGEISAVCTDPAHRGSGLATRLVRAVGAVIRDRGDVPFLHASADNTTALHLYEHLGFTLRRRLEFVGMRPSAAVTGSAVTGEGLAHAS